MVHLHPIWSALDIRYHCKELWQSLQGEAVISFYLDCDQELKVPYQCISVQEAKSLIDSREVSLVDIRDPDSFRAANIKQSVNVSGDNIEEFFATSDKAVPLIIYCYHGNSSKGAADYFFSQGYSEVYSVDGGFEEWRVRY